MPLVFASELWFRDSMNSLRRDFCEAPTTGFCARAQERKTSKLFAFPVLLRFLQLLAPLPKLRNTMPSFVSDACRSEDAHGKPECRWFSLRNCGFAIQ